jgi:hypothetical protein
VTEQQIYRVVGQGRGYELRHYPRHVVAEVELSESFEKAGNRAFRPLVSYISGRNRGAVKLAMTAPVVQQPTGTRGRYRVAFVMPAGSTVDSLPVPADSTVTVHDVPEQLAAASKFSGRWSEESYDRHVTELRAAIAAAGLTALGEAKYARFDPPWKPWFLRRNEVVIPVREPAEQR